MATTKRSWSTMELSPNAAAHGSLSSYESDQNQSPRRRTHMRNLSNKSNGVSNQGYKLNAPTEPLAMSVVTRKSTACPACKKHKIKCVMENDVPPCKRCADRGLACSKDKTVQEVMTDQARNAWNSQMERQVNRLQSALNEARTTLSLPLMQAIDDVDSSDDEDKDHRPVPGLESRDPVVEGNAVASDGLADAPLSSLYEVTRLRSLNDNGKHQSLGVVVQPDFVARNIVALAEAEQLAMYYLGRLDPFIYNHLQQYPDFGEIRKTSTLLALTVCTVAALHDPLGSEVYSKLSRELRDLASSLMFRERIGPEDVKALCMGAYWLPDMTWILSALALRQATSMQYHTSHMNQPNTDKSGFERSRMWLLIYLLNEQISILRGAPSGGIGRDFIKWEAHLASQFSDEQDLRMISHIDLLLIISRARELYGLDTTKPIPAMLIGELREFNVRVDRWGTAWSGKLARNKWLGNFPSEAVKLHWRMAKFYICSHAFRGLHAASTTSISPDLVDIAACAIKTAISILQLPAESEEVRATLVGVPQYFHTMYAFAAVFLLKVATRYSHYVEVDVELVFKSCKQLLDVFRQCPCARQHLVHRITCGLKEMIQQCEAQITTTPSGGMVAASNAAHVYQAEAPENGDQDLENRGYDTTQWLDLENFDFLLMPPPAWTTNFV